MTKDAVRDFIPLASASSIILSGSCSTKLSGKTGEGGDGASLSSRGGGTEVDVDRRDAGVASCLCPTEIEGDRLSGDGMLGLLSRDDERCGAILGRDRTLGPAATA